MENKTKAEYEHEHEEDQKLISKLEKKCTAWKIAAIILGVLLVIVIALRTMTGI